MAMARFPPDTTGIVRKCGNQPSAFSRQENPARGQINPASGGHISLCCHGDLVYLTADG